LGSGAGTLSEDDRDRSNQLTVPQWRIGFGNG